MSRVVVIAEDEPHVRRIYRLRLEAHGYEVLECPDGEAALAELERLVAAGVRPVIVVDIMMPKMDGITLLRHMRSSDALRDIPAIVATAVRDAASRTEIAGLGVHAIFKKPFRYEDLLVALSEAFDAA